MEEPLASASSDARVVQRFFCHDLTETKINQYKNVITATLTPPKVKMIQFQHSDNTDKKNKQSLILSAETITT